jgi:hypothetical protein
MKGVHLKHFGAVLVVLSLLVACMTLVRSYRPMIIVVNGTNHTWEAVWIRHCWGIGLAPRQSQVVGRSVAPGEAVRADHTSCRDTSVDLSSEWFSPRGTWGIAVEYENDERPVELVYFWSRSHMQDFKIWRFWDSELYRIVVHEGNGVEMERRWW